MGVKVLVNGLVACGEDCQNALCTRSLVGVPHSQAVHNATVPRARHSKIYPTSFHRDQVIPPSKITAPIGLMRKRRISVCEWGVPNSHEPYRPVDSGDPLTIISYGSDDAGNHCTVIEGMQRI